MVLPAVSVLAWFCFCFRFCWSFVVEHFAPAWAFCVIAILSDGQTAALGKPAQTLTPEVLEPVYGVPIQVLDDPTFGYPIILSGRKT